jgi:CheY-like chemotaxis protein
MMSGVEIRKLPAGLRVLIVDDDADAVELVCAVLSAVGCEPIGATSVEVAMSQFRECRPDVIVSDIALPGSDGYHLIRRVRARPAAEGGTTPAIALTANITRVDETRAMLAGYQYFLAKPFKIHELIAAVETVAASAIAA